MSPNPLFITSPDTLGSGERRLFAYLAREPHRVHTKHEIRTALRLNSERTVDSLAVTLRAKLADWDGRRSPVNVWGVGYRLQDPVQA